MTAYFRAAMVAATFAGGLSLTACSVGMTTARPAASHSPTASYTASASPAATTNSPSPSPPPSSPSPSTSPAGKVRVNAPIGSFPAPPGTQVISNMSCPKQVILIFGPATPARASAFYATALPQAGYQVTNNMLGSDPATGASNGMAVFQFTGHGYTGTIIAMADASSAASTDPSFPRTSGTMTKNIVEVTVTRHGVPDSYVCPGI